MLGIFPAAGKGEFLIGSPHIDGAVLTLRSGKTLTIKVNGRDGGVKYHVESVYLNGTEIKDHRIPAELLMEGGTLEFFMK